eukprot:5640690-Pyramimonas_sp.AAC.2
MDLLQNVVPVRREKRVYVPPAPPTPESESDVELEEELDLEEEEVSPRAQAEKLKVAAAAAEAEEARRRAAKLAEQRDSARVRVLSEALGGQAKSAISRMLMDARSPERRNADAEVDTAG